MYKLIQTNHQHCIAPMQAWVDKRSKAAGGGGEAPGAGGGSEAPVAGGGGEVAGGGGGEAPGGGRQTPLAAAMTGVCNSSTTCAACAVFFY